MTDAIIANIGKLMLDSGYVLVPFDNFLLVGMEVNYRRTRKVPARIVETYLAVSDEDLALDGLKKRVADILDKYPENNTEQQVYWDRLNSELDIIKQAEVSGQFLMMSDIVYGVGGKADWNVQTGIGNNQVLLKYRLLRFLLATFFKITPFFGTFEEFSLTF